MAPAAKNKISGGGQQKDNKSKKKNDANDDAEDTSKGGKGKSKLKPANSINVRHILCEKHSKHLVALEALQSGQSFDAVAREQSEDKARQGGSLGWKTRGSLLAEFESVAYALEPSSTAKPSWGTCKTTEGYHVIMVEGRK